MKKFGKLIISAVALMVIASVAFAGGGKEKQDFEIKLYTRDTTSGTRDGFFTGIGLEKAKADNAPLKVEGLGTVESNGDMINMIKNDKYGIGYISMSSLEGSGVKGLYYEGVEPIESNVVKGTSEQNMQKLKRNKSSKHSWHTWVHKKQKQR